MVGSAREKPLVFHSGGSHPVRGKYFVKMNQSIQQEVVIQEYESVFRESSLLDLSFENAERYNQIFKHTLLRACIDVSKLGVGVRVLEVGAFTGVVSTTLARLGYQVSASDVPFVITDPALGQFLKSEGVECCAVDLTADATFPHPDGFFDVIVFHSVLTHLNVNPIPILREFHRLLGEKGVIYCNTPNLLCAKNIWQMVSGKGYLDPVRHLVQNLESGKGISVGLHWREWTKAELIDLFDFCGFDVEHHRFEVTTPNRSKFPRKQLVSLLYFIRPSLMTTQIGVFRKKAFGLK